MSTNLTAAPTVELYEIRTIIKSTYAHYIIYGSCFLGLLWALFNIWIVSCSHQNQLELIHNAFLSSYSNFLGSEREG